MWSLVPLLALATLSSGAQLYLHPSPSLSLSLTSTQASAVLAHHFGLDFSAAQPLVHGQELLGGLFGAQRFVGQGQNSGLLLTLDETDAKDVVSWIEEDAVPVSGWMDASSILKDFLIRAPFTYADVAFTPTAPSTSSPPRLLDAFSVPSPSTEAFLTSITAIVEFLESTPEELADVVDAAGPRFGAFALTGLSEIAAAHGRASEQYLLAADTARALIRGAVSNPHLRIAVLAAPTSARILQRRAAQPPQQSPLPPQSPSSPVGSTSRCFADADACRNATNACSGHGECASARVAGRSCFVCACAQTKSTQGKIQSWAGEACERKDVSGPFVLLAGTTIALILMIVGSVSLLSSVGGQELPGTLTGGVAGSKRD